MIVGITTILAAIATKLAPKFTPNRTAFVSAGLITGVTETATGIGGPPLALVYQHHPAPTLRATIWSGRRDSNPRPQPWQGCALPLSYTRIREG
jgi:hypothetical protein